MILQRTTLILSVLTVALSLVNGFTCPTSTAITAAGKRTFPTKRRHHQNHPKSSKNGQQRIVPIHHHVKMTMASTTDDNNADETSSSSAEKEDEKLTPERVAEMIEVSFVQGVMELAQGSVTVLKLFIAAVVSGYSLGMPPKQLLEQVEACPDQSANRPLMQEEVLLRTTWIQVVYLVLDHVQYLGRTVEDLIMMDDNDVNTSTEKDNGLDSTIRDTYAGAIPILEQAKANGESFEAEKILKSCEGVLPRNSNTNPLEQAILSQSLRVIWLTLTVLEEEKICLEDKMPDQPRPPIPGAFS